MNKQYRELFQMVARNGAINAEKALENLKPEQGSKEYDSLITMRDSFNIIEDRLLNGDDKLDHVDYVKLYAAAIVTKNLMQKNIDTWIAVVKEYDENLIPKLQEIGTSDASEFESLVDEYFN